MLKFLFLSLALLVSFDAQAVRQSVSKALSYRNIADGWDTPEKTTTKNYRGDVNQKKFEEPVILPPKDEKVNMHSSDTAKVTLKKGDTIEVSLKEEAGYYWKQSPSSSAISLQSNITNGDSRLFKYKMLSNKASYIYFDYIKSADNSVVKSKQLTIDLRI